MELLNPTSTIKAIIVEDEIKSINTLKNMLRSNCENVAVIADALNIQEALELFEDPEMKPDVAFLDINLPDGLIFKMLEELRPIDFEVVFVTAYDEYAIKACEYSSIGYIMKPINPDALVQAVNRIPPKKQQPQMDERLELFKSQLKNPNAFERMSIPAVDGLYFVSIRDIVRFEAEDNYTHIFLNNSDGKITASKTIKSYEDMLTGLNFYRVHKSHVINLNYMRKFVKGDGGYLIMDDGKRIEVSRRRRAAFMERLRRLQDEL